MKTYENFLSKPEVKIDYYDNGQKWFERWDLNNKQHREDGPAYQCWFDNGQIFLMFWYLNGKRHREDGPSYQTWHKDGQKKSEFWYLNNNEYSREEWIEQLKEIGSIYYEEQKMLYDIEKYNL